MIVSNTNANLATGGSGGSEPSIAISPANPDRIVMESFFNGFTSNSNGSLFGSTDGGKTWTVYNTITPAPGVKADGFVCDQNIDFGRDGTLYGSFLFCSDLNANGNATKINVYTGSTSDFTSAAAWTWNSTNNVTQRSNQNTADNADQPWLIVNRDPGNANQDNAYIAYDEFTNRKTRVAVSTGSIPVNVVRDNPVGSISTPSHVNPGFRLAKDPRNGTMYALHQTDTGAGEPFSITYRLNRSTDGGQNWTLNNNTDGIAVDTVPSTQYTSAARFGGVNELRGGIDHAAVDPTNGDVYVVYGQDTNSTGNSNQLKVRRITFDQNGVATVGSAVTLSSGNAALPSIAVADDGTVGVLFDTAEGTEPNTNFPIFKAHFSRSTDHGASFTDQVLQTFDSPALPQAATDVNNNVIDQRILGDFQQLKVIGRTFYGTFCGNRAAISGNISTVDPMFFSVSVRAASTTTVTSSANPSAFGQSVQFTATITSAAGTPTGNVTIKADGNSLGTFALVNGSAHVSTSALAVGPHTITADYDGDVNSAPSSGMLAQTVNKAATTTTLTSAPNPSSFGQSVTFTATVTPTPPGAGTPTGTVTFNRGAVLLGTGMLNAAGQATFTTAALQVGTSSITASYGGDANFQSSASAALLQVVQCSQTLTGTVYGSLDVTNSLCLNNATVTGNVTVEPGGALSVIDSSLGGRMATTSATAVSVCHSTMTGYVHIVGTTGFVLLGDNGDDGQPACGGNLFRARVVLEDNAGQAEIGGNTLTGSLTVNGTHGPGPDPQTTATEIEGNSINGVLSCTGNTPAPTDNGAPNSVTGPRVGQCAAANF